MKIATSEEVEKVKSKFGLEPLSKNFTLKKFQNIFTNKKTSIKAILMNQELIAGIGNIYADEICFCAKVLPTRAASKLTPAEIKKLYDCIPKILQEAIKHRGTTFKDFRDSDGKKGNYTNFLQVYDRDGEICRRCGSIIKKTRVAGRGTRCCLHCQK